MKKKQLVIGLLSVFVTLALSGGLALAHEFVLMPEAWRNYSAGQRLPISVYTAHTFVKSDELEPAKDVKVFYDNKEVAVKANEAWLTYDGAVTLKGGELAIISGHRLPQLWSETPEGILEGGKDKHKNALRTGKYEKFAKTLLPVDGNTSGFDKVLGQSLEIIPLDNPLTAKVGDEIRIKVLLNGKPAKFDAVQATYDGFSDLQGAWAWAAEPTSHGEAKVQISHTGFWSIRVAVTVDEKTTEYDQAIYRSVLSFFIR